MKEHFLDDHPFLLMFLVGLLFVVAEAYAARKINPKSKASREAVEKYMEVIKAIHDSNVPEECKNVVVAAVLNADFLKPYIVEPKE